MDDWIRYYNIACSIAIAIVGSPQLFGRNGFLTRGGKSQLHWQSSILLNLTALWGTIEALRAGYGGGFRVYFLAIALTWLLATVLWMPLEYLRAARSTATISPTKEESP